MGSSETVMPASRIQEATRSLALRMEGEQNGRVSRSGSSLILPSSSSRSITCFASLLLLIKKPIYPWKKSKFQASFHRFQQADGEVSFPGKCCKTRAKPATAHDRKPLRRQRRNVQALYPETEPSAAGKPFRQNNRPHKRSARKGRVS